MLYWYSDGIVIVKFLFLLKEGTFMTLVSVVATSEYVSIMSDGRGVSLDDHSKIITEDYKKVFKVNSKIVMGFTGNTWAINFVTSNINNFDLTNAETFSSTLFSELGNNKARRIFNIMVGGLDSKGDIFFTGFNTSDTELKFIKLQPNSIRCGVVPNEYTQDLQPRTMLENMIGNYCTKYQSFGLSDAIRVQKSFNEKISLIDPTVNNAIFSEHVIKG